LFIEREVKRLKSSLIRKHDQEQTKDDPILPKKPEIDGSLEEKEFEMEEKLYKEMEAE
jgi:hypothetical protein